MQLSSRLDFWQNWVDKKGNNLLHLAIEHGKLKFTEYVAKNIPKLSFNAANRFGETALHICCRPTSAFDLQLISWICKQPQVDFSLKDSFNRTALSNLAFKYFLQKQQIASSASEIREENLGIDFSRFFNNKLFSDVVLITTSSQQPHQKEHFHAHKLILSCRSSTFRKMLESEFAEKSKTEIELQEIEAPYLKRILEFIYTGQVTSMLNIEQQLGLLQAADRFLLTDLHKQLQIQLHQKLSLENAFLVFMSALDSNATMLVESTDNFILYNYGEISFGDNEREVLTTILKLIDSKK